MNEVAENFGRIAGYGMIAYAVFLFVRWTFRKVRARVARVADRATDRMADRVAARLADKPEQ